MWKTIDLKFTTTLPSYSGAVMSNIIETLDNYTNACKENGVKPNEFILKVLTAEKTKDPE